MLSATGKVVSKPRDSTSRKVKEETAMTNKKTNTFYGNKNIQTDEFGYYCRIAFDPVATGEHITAMRCARHLSREKLVSELDKVGLLRVSVTTMGKWERGQVKKIEAEQLKALCIYFRCSHDELVAYRCREIDDERDPLIPYFMASICLCRCSSFFVNSWFL